MTPSSTAAKVVFGVAGLLLIGFDAPAALRGPADGFVPAPQAIARIVYVSAIDKYGNPVTDLQQADFELKVDGKKSTIVNVRPAEAPMRIALIVSDAGTGGFQLGLATFMQRLLGRAEFSLISVIVQPETVVEYSSEAGVLKAGLLRMGPRGRQRGAQLMETIQAATKHVQRDGTRPVIVVTRVGAEATTSIPGNDVREQLRQSGAILYVVSTVGAERAAPSSAGRASPRNRLNSRIPRQPTARSTWRRCSAMVRRIREAVTSRSSKPRSFLRWSAWPTSS